MIDEPLTVTSEFATFSITRHLFFLSLPSLIGFVPKVSDICKTTTIPALSQKKGLGKPQHYYVARALLTALPFYHYQRHTIMQCNLVLHMPPFRKGHKGCE